MAKVRYILWGMVALALVFAVGLYVSQKAGPVGQPAAQGQAAQPRGGVVTVEIGGPYTLTSHLGETISDTDFAGRYQFIYFGYSFCPDVCPLELQKMTAALTALENEGVDTSPIQPIFITIDPERDTVEALAQYVPLFHSRLIGLTGSDEAVRAVMKSFRVYGAKSGDPDALHDGTYLMDHSSIIFLMGPDGKLVDFFGSDSTAASLAGALKTLLVAE